MSVLQFTGIQLLEKYNFSREDASAFMEVIKESNSDDIATKLDILRLENRIINVEKEIIEIKKEITEIKKEISEIRKDTRNLEVKIESTKNQLVIWMISVMFAMTTFFALIIKYL